jgi:hypothetical protein
MIEYYEVYLKISNEYNLKYPVVEARGAYSWRLGQAKEKPAEIDPRYIGACLHDVITGSLLSNNWGCSFDVKPIMAVPVPQGV